MERSAEPASSEAFAPARNSTRSANAPGTNSFDSLANETTQAVRVSQELLGLAREDEGGGATKAYEVPPELLVLARANKAKARARRAQQGAAAELDAAHAGSDSSLAEASTRITARPREGEHAPSVIVAESDLAAPSAATFEHRSQSAALPAAASQQAPKPPALQAMPVLPAAARPKHVTRWVLIAACAIAVCAVSVLCGKLIRDRRLWTHPAADIHLRF